MDKLSTEELTQLANILRFPQIMKEEKEAMIKKIISIMAERTGLPTIIF